MAKDTLPELHDFAYLVKLYDNQMFCGFRDVDPWQLTDLASSPDDASRQVAGIIRGRILAVGIEPPVPPELHAGPAEPQVRPRPEVVAAFASQLSIDALVAVAAAREQS